MKTICAFSSDARSLYIADIYRVLALPHDHIVHFRYDVKYVKDDFVQNPNEMIGKELIVFFAVNNKAKSMNNGLTYLSIRRAVVTSAEITPETGVFHLYFSLKDFCDVSLERKHLKDINGKFLGEANSVISKNCEWNHIVNQVAPNIPSETFYHLKSVVQVRDSGDEEIVIPEKSVSGKKSLYQLTYGKRYQLRLSLANPKGLEQGLKIADLSSELFFNCAMPVYTSARFDDIEIDFHVRENSAPNHSSLVQIQSENPNNTITTLFSSELEFRLKADYFVSIKYALVAFMLAIAVGIGFKIEVGKNIEITNAMILAAVLFVIATAILFHRFNKK